MKNMKKNAQKASAFLKGMASQHRLMILCNLVEGEMSVTELIQVTGLAQTSMSQHLSKLKEEGIVSFRREHRTLYYKIKNKSVLKIIDVLYNEFCKGNKK